MTRYIMYFHGSEELMHVMVFVFIRCWKMMSSKFCWMAIYCSSSWLGMKKKIRGSTLISRAFFISLVINLFPFFLVIPLFSTFL